MSMTEDAVLKALRKTGGLRLESVIEVCLEVQGKPYTFEARNWEYPSAVRTLKALKARGLIRFNRARQLWVTTDPELEAARAGL
jgi:hypothetical protein